MSYLLLLFKERNHIQVVVLYNHKFCGFSDATYIGNTSNPKILQKYLLQ